MEFGNQLSEYKKVERSLSKYMLKSKQRMLGTAKQKCKTAGRLEINGHQCQSSGEQTKLTNSDQ
ncbi:hypothetical protein ACTXT7_004103 [Hymenolepis weldensis]